jgi:hypothetical protein
MSRPENHSRTAHIEPAIQKKLGWKLRSAYRRFIREPVPMEQIELLLALRRAERERRCDRTDTQH